MKDGRAALPQELAQQEAEKDAEGGEQRREADEAGLAALALLPLDLGAPAGGEVGVAVGRDGHHGAALAVGLLHEGAAFDELRLEVVVGTVGERAAVHQLPVDGARRALVVDEAAELSLLQYVQLDGGHGAFPAVCCV